MLGIMLYTHIELYNIILMTHRHGDVLGGGGEVCIALSLKMHYNI